MALRLTQAPEGSTIRQRTLTLAGLDVHARSTHAAAIDMATGELTRARFGGGHEEVASQPQTDSRRPSHIPPNATPASVSIVAQYQITLDQMAADRPTSLLAGAAASGQRAT
jgi:hypothetical protein